MEERPFHAEWTPEEIKQKTFSGSVWGFSRKEVRDFQRLLSKTWDRMLQNEKQLNSRIQDLQKQVQDWQAKEAQIAALITKAQADAQRLLEETEKKAEQVRSRTEAWLEQVIQRVEETERQKSNFLTAFRSALDSHYALIQTEERQTEPLTARLNDVLRETAAKQPIVTA